MCCWLRERDVHQLTYGVSLVLSKKPLAEQNPVPSVGRGSPQELINASVLHPDLKSELANGTKEALHR